MDTPQEIIPDDDIELVHANANFGDTSKRDVVNSGVIKTAFGYSTGHTAYCILREHGLIVSHPQRPRLTEKGFKYLRSLATPAQWHEILGVRSV